MDTKFSTKRAVERIVRYEGLLDEEFSTYIRVLCRRQGISRQDFGQRLGIDQQTVTYLFNGLFRYGETPEYLLQAMEKEFGLTYNEFVSMLCNRMNTASIPNNTPFKTVLRRNGDDQEFSMIEDQEEVLASDCIQRNLSSISSTIENG